jgi:branched-subunit amino acid transport protein AzlD
MMGTERGGIAGIVFAIFPHFLLFTKQILTEALYIPLLVMLLAVLLLPEWKHRTVLLSVAAGLLLGLMTLVRREAVLPAGIIVILLVWQWLRDDPKTLIIGAIWISMMAGFIVAPWLIRNQQTLGLPVLSSSGGVNFMVGNNPLATGGYTPPPDEWDVQFVGFGELERDRKAWDLSLEWIRSNPNAFLRLLPLKLLALWGPSHNWILDGADLALLPFWTLGLVYLLQRRSGWQVVASIVLPLLLCVTLIGLVFVGGWRYRLAVYPGVLMLAVYGIPDSWMEQSRRIVAMVRRKPMHE